jgi:hypothetical protein
MIGDGHENKVRDQLLYFLEINSNKILLDKAENIHYEKHLGIAEMSPGAMLDFCKRNYPDKYETFAKKMEDHPETLYLDFENVFTKLEQLPIYTTLLNCIRKRGIETMEEKSWIAMFLTHHVLRSHIYLNKEGMEKFEALVKLKWSLEDNTFMAWEMVQLVDRVWIVYKLEKPILPLSDGPIIGSPSGTLFAPLAPNTLLTVLPQKNIAGLGIKYLNRIPPSIYKHYMRLTADNTHKGLVFTEQKDAVKCQESVWWKKRRHAFLS